MSYRDNTEARSESVERAADGALTQAERAAGWATVWFATVDTPNGPRAVRVVAGIGQRGWRAAAPGTVVSFDSSLHDQRGEGCSVMRVVEGVIIPNVWGLVSLVRGA